jgi:hypothetical protein
MKWENRYPRDPRLPLQPDVPENQLAPPDFEWHKKYAEVFNTFSKGLNDLMRHPSFVEAEDLGDYVSSAYDFMSFRPGTTDSIECESRKEVFG